MRPSDRLAVVGRKVLTDLEAVQRLCTLWLGACDGIQDLADYNHHKVFRRALLKRVDLQPIAPDFSGAQPNLQAYVRDVRKPKDRSAPRHGMRAIHATGPAEANIHSTQPHR